VPVVVGEIVAGVILGRSGLDVVHTDNARVSFLRGASPC
jgi:Kef-type K+ transport system membrane component KefB